MNVFLKRVVIICLCLSLLPVYALAFTDGTPVTRSDFSLSFRFDADGFPDDGQAHYEEWEAFLRKFALRGRMDSQSYPDPIDRVYFDGGLYLNDKLTIPFEYDAYTNFRYVRSPAFGGASVHFNMYNFFQFMLKPYYYMYIPTQSAALLLYPEASVEVWRKYSEPVKAVLGGKDDRKVSYKKLRALCDSLNDIAVNDDYGKVYYFVTCLLSGQRFDWTAMEKLVCWEKLLDHLDPDRKGMTIAKSKTEETWTIGGTTIYEKRVSGDECVWSIYLPDPDGYEVSFELAKKAAEYTLQVELLLNGEEYVNLSAGVNGLPADGETQAAGEAWLELSGSGLYRETAPLRFVYDYSRTAQEKPYDMKLTVDRVSNETGKPCIGFEYQAAVQEMPDTVLVERPYDDQEDFFRLNEGFIADYKERFLTTLALAAAPVLLEMTPGVISDAVAYMDHNGILPYLGIE